MLLTILGVAVNPEEIFSERKTKNLPIPPLSSSNLDLSQSLLCFAQDRDREDKVNFLPRPRLQLLYDRYEQ